MIDHRKIQLRKQKGGVMTPPLAQKNPARSFRMGYARAPDVYAGEQEQPDHVDEMPIPGGKFEAEVLLWSEMPRHGAEQTNDQEDRTDDDVGPVKSGCHEESGAVDVAAEMEGRVRVFESLHAGKGQPQQDWEDETPFQALPVVLQQGVVRPGHGRSRREQNERVEQRQMPGIEGLDP